jgi:hypothetical protein
LRSTRSSASGAAVADEVATGEVFNPKAAMTYADIRR